MAADVVNQEDPLSQYIGGLGKWQVLIYIVMSLSDIPGAMQIFAMTFYTPNLKFRCSQPSSMNFSKAEWRNVSGQCTVLNEDVANITNDGENECTSWDYDLGIYHRTMIEEFDLVCSRDILISTSNAIYMVGFMFGVIFNGHLADRFGRKKVILLDTFLVLVISAAMIFSQSFIMFMILRGFQIFFRTGVFTCGFVLFTEVCSKEGRATLGNLFFWGFAVGMMALAGIAYALVDWFHIQIVATALFALFFILYWFLPESPKWLITQGRLEEAQEVIEKAAKMNGIAVNRAQIEMTLTKLYEQESESSKNKKRYTVINLLNRTNLRNMSLNLFFCWLVNAFVYYGLSFNTNDLGGDPFINFFISAAVEIPAYTFSAVIVRYFGRKIPLTIVMLIGGLACATPIVIPEEMQTLQILFPMIGKFCISSSFGMIYVYSAELFPTVVRNIGVGSCSMFARIGSATAPYVKELGKYTHKHVPPAVYGILSITSALLVLLLPETKNTTIPDSIEEAENMTRKKSQSNKEEIEMHSKL